jgi:hypothetical protein
VADFEDARDAAFQTLITEKNAASQVKNDAIAAARSAFNAARNAAALAAKNATAEAIGSFVAAIAGCLATSLLAPGVFSAICTIGVSAAIGVRLFFIANAFDSMVDAAQATLDAAIAAAEQEEQAACDLLESQFNDHIDSLLTTLNNCLIANDCLCDGVPCD